MYAVEWNMGVCTLIPWNGYVFTWNVVVYVLQNGVSVYVFIGVCTHVWSIRCPILLSVV